MSKNISSSAATKHATRVAKRVLRKKIDRLEMRLDARHKALIEKAAAVTGQPLTAFAISTLVQRAEAVLCEQHTLTLSRRDWKRVIDALDNPPKPTKQLIALMRGEKVDGDPS